MCRMMLIGGWKQVKRTSKRVIGVYAGLGPLTRCSSDSIWLDWSCKAFVGPIAAVAVKEPFSLKSLNASITQLSGIIAWVLGIFGAIRSAIKGVFPPFPDHLL
jgi:hypothetical protein